MIPIPGSVIRLSILSGMIMAVFKIEPIDDEAHTTISAGDKVWCKKHESATDATSEAVELGMMEAHTTPFVEETLRQRAWPPGGSGPTRSVDAVLIESIKPVKSTLTDSERGGFCQVLELIRTASESKRNLKLLGKAGRKSRTDRK
jgi:hypothetical protein